jgi:tetratricopeptide (TPR) repeat protein
MDMRRFAAFLMVALLAGVSPDSACSQTALQQGLTAYRAGNMEAAIPALERALARDSMQARAYVVLSSALLQTGQSARALRIAQEGRRHVPNEPALLLAQAEALMQQERWREALDAYQRVEERHRRGVSLSGQVSIERVRARIGQLHRIVGQRQVQSSRLDAALRHFKAAREYMPDSAGVHADLAAAYLRQKNWSAADAAARRGLQRAPDHVRLLRIRTEALSRLEKTEALLPVLRRLYQLQPEDINVGIAYGHALMANGKSAEARQLFETLIDKHPREPKIYDALVALNKRRLNYEGALHVLKRQRKQFPNDKELAMRVGRLHEKLGDYAAARAVYDSTQALAEPGDFSPTLARAQTFVEQDSLSAAIATYRRVLEKAPDHAKALRELGQVLEQQAAWAEALEVYQRLGDVEGEAGYAHAKLGHAYEELGRTDQALRAYQTAVEQDTDHPLAHYRYAVLLHTHSDSTRSETVFDAAKRALRTSFRALTTLQGEQSRQAMHLASSGMSDTDRKRQRAQQRVEAYTQIAENAFTFFANTFPSAQTEPVIIGLLDDYPDAGQLHYLAGTYYGEQGEVAKARGELKEAVRQEPGLRSAHLALGALYQEQGDFRKAVRSYERARTLDETASDAYRALLGLYQSRGKLDVLIRRWRARYRSAPQNEVLRSHLIEALHKSNRYDEARAIIEAAADSTS